MGSDCRGIKAKRPILLLFNVTLHSESIKEKLLQHLTWREPELWYLLQLHLYCDANSHSETKYSEHVGAFCVLCSASELVYTFKVHSKI